MLGRGAFPGGGGGGAGRAGQAADGGQVFGVREEINHA